MISPGGRVDGGVSLLGGARADPDSAGRGRGTTGARLFVTITGLDAPCAFLNIGAGCEPDCINSTLIRIAPVAKVPTMKPTASLRLHPGT